MAFLLYHRKTKPTGKKIAEALGIPHGSNPNEIQPNVGTVIRWGNAMPFNDHGFRNYNVLNQARNITLAGDKLESIRRFEAENVPTLEAVIVPPVRGTWFGRKRRGFGGRDIVLLVNGRVYSSIEPFVLSQAIEGLRRIAECEFFTRYVDNRREYRLHVFKGDIIRFQRKYHPQRQGNEGVIRVQNHANGFVFKQPQRALNHDRTDAAVRAVAALGLDFGAVDMVVADNRPIILEVNTAASCSPRTLEAYVEAFRRELAA